MTKIPEKPEKWPKYTRKLKNDQNTFQNLKMTKILLKQKKKKMTKIPLKQKNDQNIPKTQQMIKILPRRNLKITKIPPKSKKWPKYP